MLTLQRNPRPRCFYVRVFAYRCSGYQLLSRWGVLCFNGSFRCLLTDKVVIGNDNRLAGELYFQYVVLFLKLSQH